MVDSRSSLYTCLLHVANSLSYPLYNLLLTAKELRLWDLPITGSLSDISLSHSPSLADLVVEVSHIYTQSAPSQWRLTSESQQARSVATSWEVLPSSFTPDETL
jgi:hypothetical protein